MVCCIFPDGWDRWGDLFGAAGVWAIGVRTFNYEGQGKGKDKRKAHTNFNRRDMSVNQLWPGLVAGEWHNNHHLYPKSARSGFLNYQIDFAWYYIKFLFAIGAVTRYTDNKQQFMDKYFLIIIIGTARHKQKLGPGNCALSLGLTISQPHYLYIDKKNRERIIAFLLDGIVIPTASAGNVQTSHIPSN